MLYYVHGYMSAPDSTKGTLFNKTLGAKAIKYRDCEPEGLVISECLERIKQEIRDDKNAVLIGSSLGGFLVARIALDCPNVKTAILLNPATIPPDVDIKTIHDMPQSILKDMKDEELFFKKINSNLFVIVGTEDNVVPNQWVLSFAKVQEATVKFLKDDHSLSKNTQNLPKIVSGILQKSIKE